MEGVLITTYKIFTIFIVLSFIAMFDSARTSGELGPALHSVPSTSDTIRRFPERGSKYFGVLQSFRSAVMDKNRTDLLVSGRDSVFQLDIRTFNPVETNISSNVLLLPSDPKDYKQCYKFRLDKIECNNSMLFAVYYGSNIFACGTYSLQGRCWLISPKTMKMVKVVPGEFSVNNEFAPEKPDGKIVGLTAKNGAIFGAIQKDNSYAIRAILTNGEHIKTGSSTLKMSAPTFITSFEASDGFIYFFFTENAYEVSERTMVYSRVGRVCSFDRGSLYDFEFTTFTKSQIVCYKQGRVPDYYDHIQSATTVEVHDKSGHSDIFIYASFSTTIRSTGSSALCRFRLKDIQKLFQTSKYYVKKTENGKVKYEPQNHPQPTSDVSRMKCNSKLKSDSLDRSSAKWIASNSLLYDDIEPFDKNTVATFRGERVTSLAVEDMHYTVNKTDVGVHVLFAGTESGKVLKAVMNGTNTGEPFLAEEIHAVEKPGAISSLLLDKNYVIGFGETIPLIRMDKERCESKYLMCSDCLKARDPYCAWSLSLKKCTRAVNLKPSDRLQDVPSGSDKKCPPVDVTISCSLIIVDNFPGAWTTIQCTGHGKIPPKVVAWKKDEARLDIDHSIYEIRSQNKSSQLLVIKGYTTKELGKYGCIVGFNSNKSECSVHITATTVKPPVKITTITTRKAVEKSSTKSASTLEVTKPTQQTTYDSTTTTSPNGSPPTPGSRINCPKGQSDDWFVPFIVCLVLLILVVAAVVVFACCYKLRTRDDDEEDGLRGKKGTLDITPSKQEKGDGQKLSRVLFQKRKKVKKADSTKPLVKRDSKNGTKHSGADEHPKTAKEMDDIALDDDRTNVYLMHTKT